MYSKINSIEVEKKARRPGKFELESGAMSIPSILTWHDSKDYTVRPFQSSDKVLWLCIKNELPYTEFYADSEIYFIMGGRHKSYDIKFALSNLS